MKSGLASGELFVHVPGGNYNWTIWPVIADNGATPLIFVKDGAAQLKIGNNTNTYSGGTLINAPFRAEWWPLASLHVVLNIGLLAMELAGPRHRQAVRIGGGFVLVGALFGAVFVVARGTP